MMQPTMKLRFKKVETLYKGDPAITNSYDEKYVLQQWWVSEMFKENEESPSEITGYWIDIPIEVEE